MQEIFLFQIIFVVLNDITKISRWGQIEIGPNLHKPLCLSKIAHTYSMHFTKVLLHSGLIL